MKIEVGLMFQVACRYVLYVDVQTKLYTNKICVVGTYLGLKNVPT